MAKIVNSYFIITLLIGSALPRQNYVPNAFNVCGSMKPQHMGNEDERQTLPPPYSVKVISNSTIIHQGDVIMVALSGSEKFLGFYLQARTSDGIPIGTFQETDTVKTHDCGNGVGNAAFHGVRGGKNNLVIYWTAPAGFEGEVNFVSSFVKRYHLIWTFVKAKESVTIAKIPDANN